MIHEEMYQYMLTSLSSTEFNVCLYSLTKLDWDGHVRASLEELVKGSGTTKKYMRDIINRFVSRAKGRFIFVPTITAEGELYRFNLGKTSSMGFNEKTDRYCKKYNFFYQEAFKELPINAKRLILMGAFRMSVSKSEKIAIGIDEIVPNTSNKSSLPFTRQRLVKAIDVINKSQLKEIVTLSFATNLFTRKTEVIVSFKRGTLLEYKENHTERWLLRKRLNEAGYQSYLSDDFCVEIEKVGKYLYNSFARIEKDAARRQGVIKNAKDELVKLTRYIYNKSVDKLASALNSKQEELTEPKQVSAYFSSIVHAVTLEELAKTAHQAESIMSLINLNYLHENNCETEFNRLVYSKNIDNQTSPIRDKYEFFSRIRNILQLWCKEWIETRSKAITEDIQKIETEGVESEIVKAKRGWKDKQEGITQHNSLINGVYDRIKELINSLPYHGNELVREERRGVELISFKDAVASIFAIHKNGTNKLQNLTPNYLFEENKLELPF